MFRLTGHQRRGTATGTMDFQYGDPAANRHPGHSFGNGETGPRKPQAAVTQRSDGGSEQVGTSQWNR